MNITELYKLFLTAPSVQTDTRKLKPGDIYFALKGPYFNGNNFTPQAFAAGAKYCVVDEDVAPGNREVIVVDDALQTLQQLAAHHRDQLNIPVLAITGSNGKTTTKELLHAVLSKKYKCCTTIGNLNNHIGVPLTLLSIAATDEFAIVEMGANHLHEIESYCVYAKPNYGLITNCGKAHLEGFGSAENIRKGKGELFDFLATHNGTAFINTSLPYLSQLAGLVPHKVLYGGDDEDINGSATNASSQLAVNLKNSTFNFNVQTQLIGAYNLPNIMAAFAVGNYFSVGNDDIKSALESYCPGNNRSQLMQQNSNQIILDAYNANPSSMQLAIENIAAMPGDKKVLMLGEMKELGSESEAEHQAIVNLIDHHKWLAVLFVGQNFKAVAGKYNWVANSKDAGEWLKRQDLNSATILVKGSRGVAMENALK